MSTSILGRESATGFAWLYSVIHGDATVATNAPGGTWRGLAPPGTSTPFVVISLQSASDSMRFIATRSMTSLLYQVKVVAPASQTAASAIAAARIDTLLSGLLNVPIANTDGVIVSCVREIPLELDELVSGEVWTSIGSLYRIVMAKP